MYFDYLEFFNLSVLDKVKLFGDWESNDLLVGCFKIKCELSDTIQGTKAV